jgi:short-subunit dehydrogenase
MHNAGHKNGAVVAPASWAVVSGAASGLGLAIAKELRHDCNLLLIDADSSGLANSQQHLADGGHRIEVIVGDVSHPETWVQARSCLDGAVPQWLVQCAGVAVLGSIAEAPIGHWRKALDVNFLGPVLGCQTFAADMARLGRGHIIHIASLAAIAALPTYGPYAASKAAVVAMTETLYNEIGDRVTVTVACPSYFRSNLAGRMVAQTEIERHGLERMISGSSRSADDLAPAIIRAARRGDLYFFPPGRDRAFWRFRRLMPVRTLRLVSDKFRSVLRQSQG